jgi:hypothetical protein
VTTPRRGARRREVLVGLSAAPLASHFAGCASLFNRSTARSAASGFDLDAMKDAVDGDQVNWAVKTDAYAISEPVVRTYPPVTLLVQGSREPIGLGREMSPYTKMDDLGRFADEHQIPRISNTPTIWLFQWVSGAQGPMIFETGFVVADEAPCPHNAAGYRIKRLEALKLCSIVYRGPYPFEDNSGWNEIRWAERAKAKGFQYTEKLYRELYVRDGGKQPKRPRITVVEIAIA